MTDITWILSGVVVILFGVYALVIRPFITSKLSADQLATLYNFARIAVNAAEQILHLTTGKDKKTFAVEVVKNLLAKWHLTFDEIAIDAAIESQVYELNKDKEKDADSNE